MKKLLFIILFLGLFYGVSAEASGGYKISEFSITGFDGTSNFDITKSNPSNIAFATTTDFSVGIWSSSSQLLSRFLISRRDGATSGNQGWSLFAPNGSGKFLTEISDGTTEVSSASTGKNIADNQWHLLVATFDRDDLLSMYVDGLLEKTLSISTVTNISSSTSNNLRVGRDGMGFNRYSGSVDDARIWSGSVLTAKEISDFYFSNIVPQRGNLVLEWLFNEGSKLIATDTSTSTNTGIITSGLKYSSQTPRKTLSRTSNRF